MAKEEESKKSGSPQIPRSEDEGKPNSLFSPGFRSVAAMAGWDEETLLIASLVVEDTPERNAKHKRRSALLNFNTPPTNTIRKRRASAQRRSPAPIPVTVLDLDEVGCDKKKIETESSETADSKKGNDEPKAKSSSSTSSEPPAIIPCIDKLREELSCAICLEICFEPSTTPCGHSFCKKCLRSAADKCGKKCPKCRQLISNGRSCTVNTVLWNTIQLLFPQEVEARKMTGEAQQEIPAKPHHRNSRNRTLPVLNNSPESEHQSLERTSSRSLRRQHTTRPSGMSNRGRREFPSQDEDAALAMRLQREEFMGAFSDSDSQGRSSISMTRSNYRDSQEQRRSSLAVARANLRAMASRAISISTRNRGT